MNLKKWIGWTGSKATESEFSSPVAFDQDQELSLVGEKTAPRVFFKIKGLLFNRSQRHRGDCVSAALMEYDVRPDLFLGL